MAHESSFLSSVEAWAARRDSSHIVTLLQPVSTETIVELGAGYGYIADRIAEQSKAVVAIEPGPKRVQHMHRAYPGLDCILAVGEAIPLRDASFEKSYAKKSLHHTTDLDRVLRELNRTLKPGGLLMINELRPEGRWKIVDWIERKMRKVYMNFLQPDALEKRLENAGFSIKSLESKASGYYLVAQRGS